MSEPFPPIFAPRRVLVGDPSHRPPRAVIVTDPDGRETELAVTHSEDGWSVEIDTSSGPAGRWSWRPVNDPPEDFPVLAR